VHVPSQPTSSRKTTKRGSAKKTTVKSSSSSSRLVAPPAATWGSRFGLLAGTRDRSSDDPFERKFNFIKQEQFATEKDLEYGFARQQQQERINRRKKLVIAPLLGASVSTWEGRPLPCPKLILCSSSSPPLLRLAVIIAALILFVVLATMRIPDQQISWDLDLPKSPSVAPFPSAALANSSPAAAEHSTDVASELASQASSVASSLSSAGASIGSAVALALSAATPSPGTTAAPLASSSGSAAASATGISTQSTVWWTPAAVV